MFGYGMLQQLAFGKPWGDRPMSNTALAIMGPLVILLGAGMSVLLAVMSLTVEVGAGRVGVRFFPFVRREIACAGIPKCEAVTYRPVRDWGGWGLRRNQRGVAYNVSGDQGVELTLADGKIVLLGSQRAPELAKAIHREMNGNE